MGEMNHFSHEQHSLMLRETVEGVGDDDELAVATHLP